MKPSGQNINWRKSVNPHWSLQRHDWLTPDDVSVLFGFNCFPLIFLLLKLLLWSAHIPEAWKDDGIMFPYFPPSFKPLEAFLLRDGVCFISQTCSSVLFKPVKIAALLKITPVIIFWKSPVLPSLPDASVLQIAPRSWCICNSRFLMLLLLTLLFTWH